MKYLSRIALCMLSMPLLASAPENPSKKIDFIEIVSRLKNPNNPFLATRHPAILPDDQNTVENEYFQLHCIFTYALELSGFRAQLQSVLFGRTVKGFKTEDQAYFKIKDLAIIAASCQALDNAVMEEMLGRIKHSSQGIALQKWFSDTEKVIDIDEVRYAKQKLEKNPKKDCESCQLFKAYLENQENLIITHTNKAKSTDKTAEEFGKLQQILKGEQSK